MQLATHRIMLRRIVTISGTLALTSFGACRPKDAGTADSAKAPPVDTSMSSADSGQVTNSPASFTQRDSISGKPGKNAETRRYLHSVHFLRRANGATEDVDLDVDCNKGTTIHHSHLRIRPVHYAEDIDWDKVNANSPTHLYAEIEVSNANCPNLGLLINQTGYLSVGPDSYGKLRVFVYRKSLTGVEDVPVDTAKVIAYCNYKPKARYPGFHVREPNECMGASPHKVARRASMQYQLASFSTLAIRNMGMWVTCSTGCCEVRF